MCVGGWRFLCEGEGNLIVFIKNFWVVIIIIVIIINDNDGDDADDDGNCSYLSQELGVGKLFM